jgi:hypothetical protein
VTHTGATWGEEEGAQNLKRIGPISSELVSSVHVELDGRLPSTAGRTDETTKVTTCSVTFQLRPQTVPDVEQPSEKGGLNCEELRDRYISP